MKLSLCRKIISIAAIILFVVAIPPQAQAPTNIDCSTESLVDAIYTANSTPEADTLSLTAGCVYGFTSAADIDATIGHSALPRISTPITINGNGATLQRNSGAANFRLLRVASDGDLKLNNVVIAGSRTGNGLYYCGGIYNAGTSTVTNSTLSGNSVATGAAIYSKFGALSVTNSTLAGNYGSAIHIASGTATVNNSILWGNAYPQISGSATVTYSIVQGGYVGTGNLNVDPRFVNAVSYVCTDDCRELPYQVSKPGD